MNREQIEQEISDAVDVLCRYGLEDEAVGDIDAEYVAERITRKDREQELANAIIMLDEVITVFCVRSGAIRKRAGSSSHLEPLLTVADCVDIAHKQAIEVKAVLQNALKELR